ncbi:MAG: PD-(D/E)XK nuclease family protein [Dermatophilaceae bacterium]
MPWRCGGCGERCGGWSSIDGGRRTSDELLAAALVDPVAAASSGSLGAPLRQVARALAAGVSACRRDEHGRWGVGVTAEAVLWAIWSALGVADGWRDEALRGGLRGARADRDLDAVLGLFGAAARYADRLPGRGPDGFLDHIRGQEVPGDTLVPRAPSDDVVQVLTPAAAAGREWPLVCVAGVQEGVWPDLRLRGSLLGSSQLVDLLTSSQLSTVDAQAAVRYDETRLFYVALTRATRQLVVTAVRSDDEQPSVYLDLVDPAGVEEGLRAFTEPDRVLSMAAIVGSLRRSAAGEDLIDRQRAARLLVDLADHGVAAADPASWWTSVPAPQARPRRGDDTPVRVSPSTLERFQTCPLQWLITTSGGSGPSHAAATIGTLVHEVVALHGDHDLGTLTDAIDRRWPQLGLAHGWVSERKRHEAHDMARRIVEYAAQHRDTWEFLGAEQPFDVAVGRAVVRGSVDRLERHTRTGEVRVVDYKTGTTKVTKPELLAVHPQLGAYQVAVTRGAFPEAGSVSGGAALLYIGRNATKAPDVRLQPPLAKADDPGWAEGLIEASAEGMAAATFAARPSDTCDRCVVRGSCPAQPDGQAV